MAKHGTAHKTVPNTLISQEAMDTTAESKRQPDGPSRRECMRKREMNKMDRCFDALSTLDLGRYEGQWLLLINGECVYSNRDEERVLEYAHERHPDEVPCLVRVPTREPVTV